MAEYTPYQKNIIRRYYEHSDELAFQRLSELVADLYLAEGKKRDRLWVNAAAALDKVGIPKERATAIIDSKDPARLAELLRELDRQR